MKQKSEWFAWLLFGCLGAVIWSPPTSCENGIAHPRHTSAQRVHMLSASYMDHDACHPAICPPPCSFIRHPCACSPHALHGSLCLACSAWLARLVRHALLALRTYMPTLHRSLPRSSIIFHAPAKNTLKQLVSPYGDGWRTSMFGLNRFLELFSTMIFQPLIIDRVSGQIVVDRVLSMTTIVRMNCGLLNWAGGGGKHFHEGWVP
jgi:hypothetical protein